MFTQQLFWLTKAISFSIMERVPDTEVTRIEKHLKAELAGRLTDIRYLAKGGMGYVFLGEKIIAGTPKTVVIKVSQNLREIDQFTNEASLMASVQGPHLVQIREFGTTNDGIHYFVMDYIEGPEKNTVPMKVSDVTSFIPHDAAILLFSALCLGVREIHHAGIIHQDIKPDNFFISPKAADALRGYEIGKMNDEELVETLHELRSHGDPLAYLTDFGLAQKSDKDGKAAASGGTPKFLPPEGSDQSSFQGDLYALGITLGTLLAKEFPHDFGTRKLPHEIATYLLSFPPEERKSLLLQTDEVFRDVPKKYVGLLILAENLTNLRALKDRGDIDELLKNLRHHVERSTRSGKNVIRERQSSTRHAIFAACSAALLAAVLWIGPKIAQQHEREKFEQEHEKIMNNAKLIEEHKHWDALVAILSAEERRIIDDPRLEGKEKNDLLEKVQLAMERAREAMKPRIAQEGQKK